MLAAAATMPALLSIGYTTVHLGERELDKLEAAFEWHWAMAHMIDKNIETGVGNINSMANAMAEDAMSFNQALSRLDKNNDGMLSWQEAKLDTALGLWKAPKLAGPVRRAWSEAGGEKHPEGALGPEEIVAFGRRLRAQRAAHDAWTTMDEAAGTVHQRLDVNGDGLISRDELPVEDLQLALEVISGLEVARTKSTRSMLTRRLPELWEAASADCGHGVEGGDGKLNVEGLMYLLSDARRELKRLQGRGAPSHDRPVHESRSSSDNTPSTHPETGADPLTLLQTELNVTHAASGGHGQARHQGPQDPKQAVGAPDEDMEHEEGSNDAMEQAAEMAGDMAETGMDAVSEALDTLVEAQAGSTFAQYAHDIMDRLGLAPPYTRYRIILYIATIISFFFAVRTVTRPFMGYIELFNKFQSGTYSLRGTTLETMCNSRTDYATFFPGTFFSTTMVGYIVVLVFVGGVLVMLTSISFWNLVLSARYYLIFFAASLVLHFGLLRQVLLNWYCVKDGEVVAPRVFACVWFCMTAVNFILGPLASVWRVLVMLPAVFVEFHALDTCLLEESMVQFDIGHCSFLVATRINYEDTSPLRQAFISAISPDGHLLRGDAHRKMPVREQRKKLVRNRWHLALWLHQHESLRPLRKQALAAKREQEAFELEVRRQEEEQEIAELEGEADPVES
eukprot:gnl/TRDRNA2_/TRDRNA2_164512_c2_seq1.p1 gnl/TRDRNA2_/TRDRNA2_164512_c2~~gnl/TRDRNA2_/TRDRNA2_164512_c2_seq1.p1  ORF type:complete len:769 (-),score=114.81 gnl/TRDRNA2_/TRDRNA2_164512_c2_seq1:235-2271(-)